MTTKPKPETWMIELTAIPWAHDTRPGIVRLRMALKTLLRCFGLRCLAVSPAKPEMVPTDNQSDGSIQKPPEI